MQHTIPDYMALESNQQKYFNIRGKKSFTMTKYSYILLSNFCLCRFKNEDQTVGTLSLNIAIHPESLENEMNYMLHLPLQNLLATKKSSETQPQQSYNIVSTTTDITLDEIRGE